MNERVLAEFGGHGLRSNSNNAAADRQILFGYRFLPTWQSLLVPSLLRKALRMQGLFAFQFGKPFCDVGGFNRFLKAMVRTEIAGEAEW